MGHPDSDQHSKHKYAGILSTLELLKRKQIVSVYKAKEKESKKRERKNVKRKRKCESNFYLYLE